MKTFHTKWKMPNSWWHYRKLSVPGILNVRQNVMTIHLMVDIFQSGPYCWTDRPADAATVAKNKVLPLKQVGVFFSIVWEYHILPISSICFHHLFLSHIKLTESNPNNILEPHCFIEWKTVHHFVHVSLYLARAIWYFWHLDYNLK